MSAQLAASQLVRRGITAFVVLALLGVSLVIALPFIASTQLVRDRIVQEFQSWSGYSVKLGGAPTISVWPSIRAELSGVTLSGWGESNEEVVLTSEKVEIDLSAIAALGGDIVPTRVHFVRPHLKISWPENSLPRPKSPAAGKIRWAIEAARAAIEANPDAPELGKLPDGQIGVVEFSDATIVDASDGVGESRELLTSANGILQWPGFGRSLTLAASGEFNGESITADIRVAQPLLLFAGGSGALTVSFESEPLRLSFDGIADTSEPYFADGNILTSTTSLRELLEWTGADFDTNFAVGNTSLSGNMKGQPGSFKIEDAEIVLAENPGVGVLEIAILDGNPAVSGTLAFDELDLVSFLSALAILPVPVGGAHRDISSPAIGRLDVDMRLSANNASAGPVDLTDVAATVQINDNLATFDISDASGFGGNISTGFRVDRKSGRDSGEFRLLAADIDSGAIATALSIERMVPSARGKISIILNGPVDIPERFLSTANGSVSATFDAGTIANIDLPAFVERSKVGGFFALDEVADGTLAFERAELKATVENGVAKVEKAEARTPDRLITLAGIIPYIGRSLALSGKIEPMGEEPDAQDNLTFFVGGSWSSPFISAILTPPITE